MKYKTKHAKVLWFIFCIALNYRQSVRQIYWLKNRPIGPPINIKYSARPSLSDISVIITQCEGSARLTFEAGKIEISFLKLLTV